MKGTEVTQVAELIADAELETGAASIRLVRLSHEGPKEKLFARKDVYWIDLCLTPRRPSASARFVQEWGAHRFAGMGPIRETLFGAIEAVSDAERKRRIAQVRTLGERGI